eukprot:COSAG02_NODE_5956_length_3913_cov_3.038794_5_plen_164_part_01
MVPYASEGYGTGHGRRPRRPAAAPCGATPACRYDTPRVPSARARSRSAGGLQGRILSWPRYIIIETYTRWSNVCVHIIHTCESRICFLYMSDFLILYTFFQAYCIYNPYEFSTCLQVCNLGTARVRRIVRILTRGNTRAGVPRTHSSESEELCRVRMHSGAVQN